ncbi:MAG: ImmA/IrrE family metallo-endopeptidase, partial [Armatimonadetes bacterium]|nr:ImmA/IrrE family metallo-endopeptidase [Armatimonadota bacterium]
ERLIEARAARRIPSQKALAALISVSPGSVSKWESGTHAPDAEALSMLAERLQVRREFFLRPIYDSDRPLFYRTLSSTLVRDLQYQRSQMRWLQEISSVVGHYVEFPEIDIPDVLSGGSYRQLRDDDIERIALDLRRHWGLGEGPCADVVSLLERIGCVVGSIEMGTSKLDGLCSWSKPEGRPHVLLSTDKMSFPRRQMDAAHELGHAILHGNVTETELKKNLKEIESQAFRFASAFLMPSTTYPYEVRNPSIASLLALKERWRIAVKAQIVRLAQLELIPDDYKVSLFKLLSAKGWNKGEPLDDSWPLSKPKLLHDALNLITDSGSRTKADLLSVEFTMGAGDIENVASLPPGWFLKSGEVVPLKLKTATPKNVESAEIIPFRR